MERVKWDEMIAVMSCCYGSMSCPVGMGGGFWLGHLAISDDESFAGAFSRRHRWVFVGPCHLCVHGPPAFTLWFRVSHTHTCFTTCYIGYNSPNVMYYLDLGGFWLGYLFGNEILRNLQFLKVQKWENLGKPWENLRNQGATLRLVMNVVNTPKISPLAPVGGCTSKSNS